MANSSRPGSESVKWRRCESCGEISYGKKWRRGLGLCPSCGHHGRLTATERVEALVDTGSFRPLDIRDVVEDPLGFVDSMPYKERLRKARERTGQSEAVLGGTARILGHAVVIAVMEFGFLGGSLGIGAGERLTAAAEHALMMRRPLLLVTASGGARMQEGAWSLMQMAKVSGAIAALREAGIATISLITDPTYGGVAASFATQADVILAEPKARLGFAGPRVIRQTMKQDLPPGFQTAEFLLERGLIDLVVPRPLLRDRLGALLSLVDPQRTTHPPATMESRTPPTPGRREAWTAVLEARNRNRPTFRDYLSRICEVFVELHGDRTGSDSPTVVGGLARIAGHTVVVVGTQKGHSTEELIATSFGMAGPEGYRKACRLFELAERLAMPVVTIVDTPGAYPGAAAEEQGQAGAIAESILRLTSVHVPVVAAIVGEGGSGGALALAVADRVLMSEQAIYSVISPEGCAAILWNSDDAPTAARALRLTAADLLEAGIVDRIVPEPEGGSQADHGAAAAFLEAEIGAALRETSALPPERLVASRRERLRRFGDPSAFVSAPDDHVIGAAP